jgi:hypothetical protein
MRISSLAIPLLACATLGAAERINHDGRVLGPAPTVSLPTLFNTAQADAIVSAMQIMPRDSAWNEDISQRPLLGNNGSSALSDAMITNLRDDVYTQLTTPPTNAANRRRMVVFEEMNYVLVPDSQATVKIDINFFNWPDESDDLDPGNDQYGLWPIPSIMPVESWPSGQPGLSNLQWQQDINGDGGDRHSIIVMPGTGFIWETWMTQLTGHTPAWEASNGAKFPLTTNAPRPAGWTSGDAAGLPMFPALVRYDEVQRGMVEHAVRIVVKRSRQNYIYPASHSAGSTTNANYPSMGQRLRLKSSFAFPASWSAQERALGLGLKKYGALVADNGGFFSVSICPDDRWPANCWNHFSTGAGSDYLDINNFEVVDATPAGGGPRGGTPPTCNAGSDQSVTIVAGATLNGSTTAPVPAVALTTLWEVYAKPAGSTVNITTPGALTTAVGFSAVGDYTLRLKASDGTHAPAYDAVIVHVTASSYPLPTVTSISPTMRERNSGQFTLTVNGTGFTAASWVTWASPAQTDLVPATVNGPGTQLTVTVPASYLSATGTPTIKVVNPAPGGGTSASGQLLSITADVTAPSISGVTVSGITTSGATIGWTTNEAANSLVDYGSTAAYGSSSALDGSLVTSHSLALGGLAAGTLYHFRVRSTDGSNNAASSGDATFTTSATPPAGGGGGGSGGGGGGGGGGCGLGGAVAALLALGALWLRRLR